MEELTPTQIGARLGVSERTIQRWLKNGRLKATLQANGYYLIDPADIDALKPPTLPSVINSASADADILNRIERLEQQVSEIQAKFEALSSQPPVIPATSKQPISALSHEQKEPSTLPEGARRGRPREREGKRQPVPADLPEGTIHVLDFANDHGVNRRTFVGQIVDHDLEHIAIPSNRAGEYKRYLTSTQQQEVVRFWQEHNLYYQPCEDCPH